MAEACLEPGNDKEVLHKTLAPVEQWNDTSIEEAEPEHDGLIDGRPPHPSRARGDPALGGGALSAQTGNWFYEFLVLVEIFVRLCSCNECTCSPHVARDNVSLLLVLAPATSIQVLIGSEVVIQQARLFIA